MSTLLSKTGIGQLTAILEEHIKTMEDKNDTVDKIIDGTQTMAQSLRDAKRKALENEKALLLSIMDDIDEMNSFLKNIILIENLFNQNFQPYKQQQEQARAKYAPNIAKYEQKPKVQSKANSFVELIFGGQTHVSSFQTWIDKVVKQCNIQNVKILKNSNAKVKKIERAFYKAFYVYSEQDGYKEMTDVLRCSLSFDDFDNLYQCFSIIEQLAEATTGGILRVKDRYHPAQMPFGYRDLLINVLCPESTIIAEIQLHFIEFYKYKKISHAMYKRARLFERNDCNLAYDYAEKFLRPKLGTFKVYQVSKDDIENDNDNKESKEMSLADMKYNVLLKDWGLGKYIAKMGDEGWDEAADWKEITDEDLKNDIGMSKGHIKKFRRRYEEWLTKIAQEESKQNIAVYQEQVYSNPQPQMQLRKDSETKQQEYEMKKDIQMKQNDDEQKQAFDNSPGIKVKEFRKAKFKNVSGYQFSSDSGSGGTYDVKFYKPNKLGQREYLIGYVAKGQTENTQVLIISEAVEGQDVKRPISCWKVWDDHGSGNDLNYQLWRPVAPQGFIAMSDIPNFRTKLSNGSSDWGIDQIWCVSKNLVKRAGIGGRTWTDKGTGSTDDGSIWKGQDSNFMFATKGYNKPNVTVWAPN